MLKSELSATNFVADLFDSAVIAFNKDGHVVFYNHMAEYLFNGLSDNKTLSELVGGDELSVLRHNLNIVFFQQRPMDFYWMHKERLYLVAARLFASKVFLCLRDITEIRAQSDLLKVCSRRFNQIEQLSQIGYWELNLSHKIFYWSDGMYNLFNLNKQNKNYHHNIIRRFIHPDDIEFYRQSLRRLLLQDKLISGNIRIFTDNNVMKICRFSAAKIMIDGEENACGIMQNITDYCRTDEKKALTELAHSVKQQIQAIKLFSDSLSSDVADPIRHHINITADLLNQAVGQLHEDSSEQYVDVAAVSYEICREFDAIAQAKGLKLICRTYPLFIKGDKKLLELMLRNLLDNAFKFAKSKVVLANNHNGIWVADDGCGIALSEPSKIFSCYYHGKNSCGWGVGLAMVCNAAKQLDAAISLKSRLGHYSIFRLTFSKK